MGGKVSSEKKKEHARVQGQAAVRPCLPLHAHPKLLRHLSGSTS